MKYIRDFYGVPAKRGRKVQYLHPGSCEFVNGVITGSRGAHLRIRLEGALKSGLFHPGYHLIYMIEAE